MFAPQPVPLRFKLEFPVGLTLRPSQIRATSEDASNMITDAKALSERYSELSCPVAILAGDADGVVNYRSRPCACTKNCLPARSTSLPARDT